MPPPSTTDDVARLDEKAHHSTLRARRLGYGLTAAGLAAFMASAVADVPYDVYGVDSDHERAAADGWELEVRYPTVSRAALASPFELTITRDGGFDGQQVTVAVSADYLAMWDENGLDPAPAEETADDERVYWTFEPPEGDVLRVELDARIEPAAQEGRRGRAAVLDAGGAEVVAVDFETRVRP